MNKYKTYIPVLLIILMFFALIFFRGSLVGYMSQSKTEQLPTIVKDTMAAYITKNYDYSKNGENYEYTFLEFGSTGCHACRQMEEVMEKIKSKYENKVKVIFVNVMKMENRLIAEYFGIALIPTQVILDKKGHEIFRHTGYISAEDLENKFK